MKNLTILGFGVLLVLAVFTCLPVCAKDGGTTPAKASLLKALMNRDMLYGTDDYFGACGDVIYVDTASSTDDETTSESSTTTTSSSDDDDDDADSGDDDDDGGDDGGGDGGGDPDPVDDPIDDPGGGGGCPT